MNSHGFFLAMGVALAASAPAAAFDLGGRPVDLAVSPIASAPDSTTTVVGSQADLTTSLDNLETRLHFGLETGPKTSEWERGRWDGNKLAFGAVWTPSDRAKLELNANSQNRRDVDLITPADVTDARREVFTQDSQARAAATLALYTPLSLTVGGDASTRGVRTDLSDDPAVDRLWTRSREVFSTLTWHVSPMLQLQSGARLHTLGVDWVGAGDGTGDYTFVEPEISGALTPWNGAAWRLGLARVVSPLNTDQFIDYAKTVQPGSHVAFAPDQAWRYQASFSQKLKAASVSATITQSRLQAVTDYGPTLGGEAPMDIGGGSRREFEGVFSTPVKLFGITGTTLRARTSFRDSEVRDPFTGQTRRASGEAPYDAQVSLSQQAAGMRWGVTAQATGAAHIYQMSQVVTRSANTGLGAFVEYDPGPVRVRLNLDNVVGGERLEQTVYYAGSRAYGQPSSFDQTRTAERAIGLTLTRPLN